MKIRFYLRCIARDSTCLINCQYSHESGKWRFPTKLKCNKSDWNKRKQRIKTGKSFHQEINDSLQFIENKVMGIALKIRRDNKSPIVSEVKRIYEGEKDMLIWDAWDMFKESYISKLAINTQKRYRTAKGDLMKYEEERKRLLVFSSFDYDFPFRYSQFLIAKGNNETTITKKVKDIKSFLGYALRQGWHKNIDFKGWKAVYKNTESKDIALTRHEVTLIEQSRVNDDLSRIRDLFIFQCHTGLRYSDTQALEKGQIFNNILHFNIIKTEKRGSVALSETAKDIYNRGIPKITNQYYNRSLKELCKSIGESFEDDCIVRGKTKPRWKAVSSHTARRTFVTIMLETAPLSLVSRIVGHSSTKITEGYDKTGDDVKYRAVREVWG